MPDTGSQTRKPTSPTGRAHQPVPGPAEPAWDSNQKPPGPPGSRSVIAAKGSSPLCQSWAAVSWKQLFPHPPPPRWCAAWHTRGPRTRWHPTAPMVPALLVWFGWSLKCSLVLNSKVLPVWLISLQQPALYILGHFHQCLQFLCWCLHLVTFACHRSHPPCPSCIS